MCTKTDCTHTMCIKRIYYMYTTSTYIIYIHRILHLHTCIHVMYTTSTYMYTTSTYMYTTSTYICVYICMYTTSIYIFSDIYVYYIYIHTKTLEVLEHMYTHMCIHNHAYNIYIYTTSTYIFHSFK